MLYGYDFGVFGKSNYLKRYVEIRFFWLPLSKIKGIMVPFTHICEWKRCPSFSGSSGSSGCIVAITTLEMGYT
jgi:hypothetical protein